MIEVRGLTRKYGSHVAVDNLSFSVEKGRVCGFLGPNGAGKSTTMNIMTGYLGLTDGVVTIGGSDIAREPEKTKRMIGYLPENPPLYNDMTPREYLEFAAALKGISKSLREGAIREAAQKTGISDVLDRLIGNLSKGYRQRVGLAQAIIGMPPVLILDEPTSGLDPGQIREIRALIRGLAREHTIILSSHILSEVREVCDYLLIIHNGKLMASGTPDELLQAAADRTLELTVKSRDAGTVREALAGTPGVESVKCSPESGGEVSAVIVPGEDGDPREDIWRACVVADIPILMMKPSGASLETIFLRLTSDIDQNADEAAAETAADGECGKAEDAGSEAEADTVKETDGEETDGDSDIR